MNTATAPPLTRARIDGALRRAGNTKARLVRRRASGEFYTLGYRIQDDSFNDYMIVHYEIGYVSVAGPRLGQSREEREAALRGYAETLRAYGYDVIEDVRKPMFGDGPPYLSELIVRVRDTQSMD